jgi:4-hydroxybenzoate polyprenyltransferase
MEFFLMVGVAANYLDETKGRPWKTNIPDAILWGIGAATIIASSAIGLYLALHVGWWFIAFVAAWGFLTASYSLELFRGRLHNTETLGALVALASLGASLVQDARPTWLTIVVALLSAIIAGYGREHYEDGKPAGRDGMPLPLARRFWRWLMLEIVVIDAIAAIILAARVFV